ncbi:MAG: tripartite tricarboxylate transporter substrate binding protein [Xanthobacteraceae bacterium]|nr:tripartite tricarboxylate transporter substrate binding protein [Xanthobacteraceae bacterium]
MNSKITRRSAIAGLSAVAVAPAFAQPARPEGTITVAHGFTPGGNVDLTARLIAERLAARLNQQVIVEPRPGAGGSTAAASVARAAPDGKTLFLAAGGHAVSAAIYKSLPYKPLEDFSWISMLSDFPFVFVTYPDHPAKNLAEFIARAKSEPGKLLCAHPGNGTGQHLALELFAATAGIKVQSVPYRGSPQAATDLLGKRVDAFMDNMTVVAEMVRDGRLRALGITGPSRFFVLPDVQTFAEQGVKDYAVTSWLGLAGPAAIPAPMLAKLNEEVVASLKEPDTIERLRKIGGEARPTTSEAYRARVASDIERWTKTVASANIERI